MTNLVLSRRIGETIVIGADITVTVVGMRGNQTSLKISAPEHIPVHREEIAKLIAQEGRKASA